MRYKFRDLLKEYYRLTIRTADEHLKDNLINDNAEKNDHLNDSISSTFSSLEYAINDFNKSIYGLDKNIFKKYLEDDFDKKVKNDSNDKAIFVNKEKKTVVIKFYGKTIIERCDKDDKFDWKIGFGLCLSKLYENNFRFKQHRDFFRNKQTRKLDYKKYAKWCIVQALNNDMIELDRIEKEIEEKNCAIL